ncbi:adenylate/guanylate cyclase domain-containing protein [Paenibacillus polymyxa]|uniref:adenylate/guanylate cyclase domain-containing protein n=1 Tax=Paenibacillus polymyxa TaxID=1406 RepID=UPI0023783163|nr:adenylate/guanylate cyclase domain-containing protein [Paenibacillus polymyxa]WDM22323.1 adenylate cyclase [Paenibacillus polymyxa]
MNFNGYDYKERKKKVEEILDNTDAVKEVEKFPRDADFTYTNGYKAWAGAIFVDLRDSTSLFSKQDYEVEISKVIRGFTSEIIEILRKDTDDTELKEIGIRGDCVYAVYSTPSIDDIYDISNRACYINTYMKMLNKLLEARALPTIKIGIGMATKKTLAVKAGRKSSGIHNLVWIGESVAKASKLSDLGNKDAIGPIIMSSTFHHNYTKKATDKEKGFWTKEEDSKYGVYYHGNVIITDFNNWISSGMQ